MSDLVHISGHIDQIVRRLDTPAMRIARLQAQARALATEQTERLLADIADLFNLAHDIAEGGEVYPVGVREIARRLKGHLTAEGLTLQAIVERT